MSLNFVSLDHDDRISTGPGGGGGGVGLGGKGVRGDTQYCAGGSMS